MNKYLLIINAGLSSIKFALYRTDASRCLVANMVGQVEDIGGQPCFTVKSVDDVKLADCLLSTHEAGNHIGLDDSANAAAATCISTLDSKLSVWIAPTNENLMIARHTLRQVTVAGDKP